MNISSTINMKMKSVSAEDLGNIVKQMINGAHEDNEQILKFYRVIYEEWYYRKMTELKDTNTADDQPIDPGPQVEQDISATVAHHRTRKYRYKRQTSQSSLKITEVNSDEVQEISPTVNEKCKVITTRAEVDTKDRNKRSVETINVVSKHSIENVNGMQIIEIWNNTMQRPKVKNKPDDAQENEGSKKKQPDKEKLSFDAWKRKKTAEYRQMLKEERKEKRQALLAKITEMERKRIALEEQARIRQQENQRSKRLSKKYMETIKQANIQAYENQMETKRIINEKAFQTWKKRKDMKQKEERMMMQTYPNYGNNERKDKPSPYVEGVNVDFNSWLNRLDWVLHEKYLRERRHLVRSFYCQPVYYGDASICAR